LMSGYCEIFSSKHFRPCVWKRVPLVIFRVCPGPRDNFTCIRGGGKSKP
jgi:hypothetical protein